jgi:hypothetical protein
MQSNPIQQRIELICEKWEDSKKEKASRVVRLQCEPDEADMVDTFYTYMVGVDTPIADIAFLFDTACTDLRMFSTYLLIELEEIMNIWNNSQKDERIDFVPIRWKADYSLQKDKNSAAMFVDNFNKLAKEMDLPRGLHAVAVFRNPLQNKDLLTWFEQAMALTIAPSVKLLIHDTVNEPTFNPLARYAPLFTTMRLNLNMPKAMEQVAAMGDPLDPATQYRQLFMKMINAMDAGKESETEEKGKECIAFATQLLGRDPYWITQVIVVYTALANDKIRYKKKKESLSYANQAVETATASKVYFENDTASVLLAQTLMFRATIHYVQDNLAESLADYEVAFELYKTLGNLPLAIEASRMAGKIAIKLSQKTKASGILTEGLLLGQHMDLETARGSTYAGVLELLLQTNYTRLISMNEIETIATRTYGDDWVNVVNNWKRIPDKNGLQQQELKAVNAE